MQTWSGPNTGGTNASVRKLTLYTLLGFSLAGLIAGFVFGGFVHSTPTQVNTPGPIAKTTPTAPITSHIVLTPTPEVILPLGLPLFQTYPKSTESLADRATYSVGIQVINHNQQPVHASDITCKAWLVQQIPQDKSLHIDPNTLKDVNNLTNPIAGTIDNTPAPEVGGLVFDPTTPQTGLCDANGQMTWKYTLAPTLAPATYDLVVLTDWKGKHYNWSWVNIKITA